MTGGPSREWIRFGCASISIAIGALACGHFGAGGDGIRRLGSAAVSPDSQTIDEGQIASWTGSVILAAGTAGTPSRISWDFDADGREDSVSCDADASTAEPPCATVCEATRRPLIPTPGGLFLRVADLNGDGRSDVAVSNLFSDTVSIFLGSADGAFEIPNDVPVGSQPRWVDAGDFDGDGNADLAVSTNGTIWLLFGDGNGRFPDTERISTGQKYAPVVAGDFDHDSRLDLMVAGTGGNLDLLRGDGLGGFGPPVVVGNAPRDPHRLEAADLDRDGNLDIVVAGTGETIFRGQGDGTFISSGTIASTENVFWSRIADVDGDGNLDLVFPTYLARTVDIALGSGSGTFGPVLSLPAGFGPYAVDVGDYDGDGVSDIVSGNFDQPTFSWFRGSGAGSFESRIEFVGGYANALGTGDFDGDGRDDLLIDSGTTLRVIRYAAGSAFDAIREDSIPSASLATSVQLSDVNEDGVSDLLVTYASSNSVAVSLGDGAGSFGPSASFSTGASPTSIAVGDVNEDGHQDVLLLDQGSEVSILPGSGAGTFGPRAALAVGSGVKALLIADFDRDGHLDLAIARTSSAVSVLRGAGDGTFGPKLDYPTGSPPSGIAAADLDGDGIPDLVASNASAASVSFLRGIGDGTFATRVDFSTGGSPQAVTVADVNHDGRPDVLVPSASPAVVFVLLGDGSGGFSRGPDVPAVSAAYKVSLGDVDSDGVADLVAWVPNAMWVALGRLDGTFQPGIQHFISLSVADFALADVDRDGASDIVVVGPQAHGALASYSAYFTAILRGSIRFRPDRVRSDLVTASEPSAIAAGDFDGDSDVDLAVANGNAISVFRGDGSGGFAARVDDPTASPFAELVAVDLDGDGRADLAASGAAGVSVLLADPSGGFSVPVVYPTGSPPRSLHAADLNGDSTQDLIVANGQTISVFLGSGGGQFLPRKDSQVGAAPGEFAIGDLDGDGIRDLAVGTGNLVTLLRGNGDGTFVPFSTIPCPYIRAVVLADFDGDGILDLALTSSDIASAFAVDLVVRLGIGGGAFGPSIGHRAIMGAGFDLLTGDFNRDGVMDLAISGYGIEILTGSGGGVFETAREWEAAGFGPRHLAVGDFDGDGVDDLAATAVSSPAVTIVRGPLDDGDVACQVSASHVYDDSKGTGQGPQFTWAAALRVEASLETVTEFHPVTVRNVAPFVSAVTIGPVAEGEISQLQLSWTDPGTNDAFAIFADWGDGMAETYSRPIGATSATLLHAYTNGGSYTMSVVVSDDENGAAAPSSLEVVVNDTPPALVSLVTDAPVPAGSAARVTIGATPSSGDHLVYDFDWDGDGAFIGPDDVLGSSSNTSAFTRGTDGDVPVHVRVRDDDGNAATGVIDVDWQPTLATDHAPVAVADSLSTSENAPIDVPVAALLSNDSDPDAGDAISFVSATQAAHGSVLVVGSSLRYTPAENFHGPDGFNYTIGDALGVTATAAVSVDVDHVNQPPMVGTDSLSTTQGFAITIPSAALLANDVDADGDPLAISSVAIASTSATVSLVGSNVVFAPAPSFHGITSFTDVVSDGIHSVSGTVFVTVLAVEHGPGMPGISSPIPSTPVSVNPPALVVIDAVDVDADPLTYEFQISTSPDFQGPDLEESGPVPGTPQLTSWTPADLVENTTYHWRARANDGALDSPWASSSFFVDSANDPPLAPIPVSPADGSLLDSSTEPELTVLDATDPEGEALSYEFEISRGGALVLDSAGIAENAIATSWQLSFPLEGGAYEWKARAIDARGGVGPWSDGASFRIVSDSSGGCGCDLGGSSTASPIALLGGAALVLVRWRRSRSFESAPR